MRISPGAIAPWPAEVDLILSAMEAGKLAAPERREGSGRTAYRVRASLRLFSDPSNAEPWRLYTRDIDPRGLGFLSPQRLPLGYGGFVELFSPRGTRMKIQCTLFRCRVVVAGWYEGALYFNRPQFAFALE